MKTIGLPPFGVLAEYQPSKNPYFATGAGGLLQSSSMASADWRSRMPD